MFHFSNLQILAEQLRQKKRGCASFAISYHGHPFSNLYIDDFLEPTLFVTSLGDNAFTIKLIGDRNFNFDVYLGDNYRKLCSYLNLNYDPANPFRTTDFFVEYNALLVGAKIGTPRPSEIATMINSEEKNRDEAAKIYFCGWHPLPKGDKVRELNFKKTCGIVGYEEAARLRGLHVSSNWSADPHQERLEMIAQSTSY